MKFRVKLRGKSRGTERSNGITTYPTIGPFALCERVIEKHPEHPAAEINAGSVAARREIVGSIQCSIPTRRAGLMLDQ